jgi:hypothetical protein
MPRANVRGKQGRPGANSSRGSARRQPGEQVVEGRQWFRAKALAVLADLVPANVRCAAESASIFGAHMSEVAPAPCSRTRGGAAAGPLIRTNVAPYVVGTTVLPRRQAIPRRHASPEKRSRYPALPRTGRDSRMKSWSPPSRASILDGARCGRTHSGCRMRQARLPLFLRRRRGRPCSGRRLGRARYMAARGRGVSVDLFAEAIAVRSRQALRSKRRRNPSI